jgi:predicted dehydrogenase
MFFMGNPKPLSVMGATYSKFAENNSRNSRSFGISGDGTYDVEDFAAGFVRLENGATIDFEFCWASNFECEYNYYELLGTKGGALFKGEELKIFSEVLDTCVTILPDTRYTVKALDEFEHFIDCIKNGKEPLASPEQAVDLMKIIDGVYKSSEMKREIIIVQGY